jgi:hypothetical protein
MRVSRRASSETGCSIRSSRSSSTAIGPSLRRGRRCNVRRP